MAAVGTVKVKVKPDLDGFAEAIREEIRRIVREEIEAFASGLYRGLTGEDATARGGSMQTMTDPYGKDFR